MTSIFLFLSTFFLSAALVYTVRVLALKKGWVSKPRERDVHSKPVPRIGGVGFYLAFLISSLIFFLVIHPDLKISSGLWFGIDKKLAAIWIASLLITVTMLVDDLKGVKALVKLTIQIAAALIIIASGVGIDFLSNPFGQPFDLNTVYLPLHIFGNTYHFSLISDIFSLFWIVGMMNVINFIDGIDGLAGGISTIAAFTIFLLSISIGQPSVANLALILVASTLGFLIWNFYPAKIFMGDTGSMFLGLMLGILPLISGGKLATAFLVLGFVIIDGLIVAGSRIIRHQNPFTTPDKTHLHHRFLAAGFSVPQAVLSLYAIAILFAWVALRATPKEKLFASILLVIIVGLLIMILNTIKKRRRNV